MKSVSFRILFLVSVIFTPLLAGVLLPGTINAATPTPPSGGGGMELSPVLTELTAKPGQSVTTTIRLRNVTKIPFVVTAHADDFTAKGENGEPQVLPDNQKAPTYSLRNWFVLPGDVLLEPNVYRTIPLTINVPTNAEPGGHYGVIRFANDQATGSKGTGVSLTTSVGSLLLLRVSGKVVDSLKYLTFETGNGTSKSSFFEKGTINFVHRVKNDGNIHEKPTGQVVILTSNGKKIAGLPINEKSGNVLPGSTRVFTETWKTKAIFGHYTATAHLAYAGGKTLESPIVSFWIIPFHLIGYIVLALFILFVILKLLGKRYSFSVSKAKR